MCFVDDMVSNFEIGIGLQGCLFECFFIFCDGCGKEIICAEKSPLSNGVDVSFEKISLDILDALFLNVVVVLNRTKGNVAQNVFDLTELMMRRSHKDDFPVIILSLIHI